MTDERLERERRDKIKLSKAEGDFSRRRTREGTHLTTLER